MTALTRRARGAAVAGCALLLVACGPSPDAPGDPEASPAAADPTPSPTPSAPVADADHAVAPPGPLEDRLYAADVLVYAPETLSRRTVERIAKLPGVEALEQLSLAAVPIENKVFTLGAVDPGSYRRFTFAGKQQEIWERVAGGELALPREMARSIGSRDDFVQLGAGEDAPSVHVGAYAEQAFGVDMVVNERWGEDLGMVEDNALLLNTGFASPESVRPRIRRVIGKGASIQMLDVVAREGLDPDAAQVAVATGGSVAAAVGTFSYRVIGGGRIAPDPAWVAANIRTEVVPILGRMTCHKAMLQQLRGALQEVVEAGLANEVYQTAGCYYPRFIAGTTRLSNHSFGTAIDLNSLQNQRGTVGEMHRGVVAIFKKWGFSWGGDWNFTDPMHFELSAIVEGR